MRSEAVKPGDVIAGKYRVRTILGRNRGILVDAFHVEFDQRVIARVLSPTLCDEKQIERFRREARILVKLESEHVARIIDFGSLPDGGFYLVRQYLEGTDLATALRKTGRLPLAQAVHYTLQATEAVAETHAHNILLRELQPGHLFLAQRLGGAAAVKIIDFGTAKLMREAAAPGSGDELTSTTMFGMSCYSSPELVRKAKVVDIRTDIWSLGAILYEMLAGRPPFQGEMAALMLQITREDPPLLSTLRRELPKDIDQVIRWALAKDVDGRFPNAHAFANALAPFAPPEAQGLIQRIGELTRVAKERRHQAMAALEGRKKNVTDGVEPETLDPDEVDYLLDNDDEEITGSEAATQLHDHASLGITPDMRRDLLGGAPRPKPAATEGSPLERTQFIGADYVPPSPAAPGPPAPPRPPAGGPSPPHPSPARQPPPFPPASRPPPGPNGGAAFAARAPSPSAPAFGQPPVAPAFGQAPPGMAPQAAPNRGLPVPQGSGFAQPAASVLGPGQEFGAPRQQSHPFMAGAASNLGGSAIETGGHRALRAKKGVSRGAVAAIAGSATVLVILVGVVIFKFGGSDAPAAAVTEGAATEQPAPPPAEPASAAATAEPASTAATTAEPAPTGAPAPTSQPTSAPTRVAAAEPRPSSSPTQPKPSSAPTSPAPTTKASSTPASPSGGGTGTLVAVAVGGTCEFSVNGASKGTSSSIRVQLKPGTYSVSCRPTSGGTKTKSVAITDGGSAMAMFKLQ